ncbi:MAG: hypothetical protein GY769_13470 [bacterium]|nr:hypothetical protein [bacterium]
MSHTEHFARRFRFQRVLQGSLAIGGLFNLGLGALLGLAPDTAVGVLHISRPDPQFYLQVLATLAALLGCYYLLAASDVRRYSGIVALATSGRFLIGLVLLIAAASDSDLAGLYLLAGVEILFGTLHIASWWSIR